MQQTGVWSPSPNMVPWTPPGVSPWAQRAILNPKLYFVFSKFQEHYLPSSFEFLGNSWKEHTDFSEAWGEGAKPYREVRACLSGGQVAGYFLESVGKTWWWWLPISRNVIPDVCWSHRVSVLPSLKTFHHFFPVLGGEWWGCVDGDGRNQGSRNKGIALPRQHSWVGLRG